jgi:hypothetical protein
VTSVRLEAVMAGDVDPIAACVVCNRPGPTHALVIDRQPGPQLVGADPYALVDPEPITIRWWLCTRHTIELADTAARTLHDEGLL